MTVGDVFQRCTELIRRVVAAQPQGDASVTVVEDYGGGEIGALAHCVFALGQHFALEVGDLLDVPLTASIAIQSGNVLFGDRGIRDAHGLPLERHVIAVTGPSSDKLLARPTKKGALSPAAVALGLKAQRFLSKGVDRRQYQRLTDLQVRPENRYVKTIDEIWKLNQRYDDLHFSKDSGLAPDGSDLE